MIEFHEHLKKIRKGKNKTQKEIAAALGITERNYQSFEYGKSKPSFGNLIALADFFNVSLDYLVGRNDDFIFNKDSHEGEEACYMYRTEKTVTRIKETAKTNGIKISEMLSACGLNINTLSSMSNRGSWIQANSLAMIADYLNVSVDYLLGRTDYPMIDQLEKSTIPVTTIESLTIVIDGIEYQLHRKS